MKSIYWDEVLELKHRAYIQSERAQAAFDTLVDAATNSPDFITHPDMHGKIRDFRYFVRDLDNQPFAFVINREDLLFYIRKAGHSRVIGGLARLSKRLQNVRKNSAGKWTIRITNKAEAEALKAILFPQTKRTEVSEQTEQFEDDLAEIDSVIVDLVRDPGIRHAVLAQLVSSAEEANAIAPTMWAVAFLPNGFRLSVGELEVFVCIGGVLRLSLADDYNRPPYLGNTLFKKTTYASVPEHQCAFIGNPFEFSVWTGYLQDAHKAFIQQAAKTKSTNPPNGSSFRGSQTSALMYYARTAIARAGHLDADSWIPEEQ